MRSLPVRVAAGVFYACVFFAIAAIGIGVVGIVGVRSTTGTSNSIAADELKTATVTARLGQDLDIAYSTGLSLLLSNDPAQRAQLGATLYNSNIPTVEADLASLLQIHAGDKQGELAGIKQLVGQWGAVRDRLNQNASTVASAADAGLASQLSTSFMPLTNHVQALINTEDADGLAGEAHASSVAGRTIWLILVAVGVAVLAAIGLGWAGGRHLRRAMEPAQDQVEFADTLQLAEDEDEAHHLLQHHLERTVAGGTVTVFNRNNSADRLEASTPLAPGSPLVRTLQHAEPRSCLAVRSGRGHDEDEHRPSLLACPVCGTCPGRSMCTPLTVGGEVIGSVLVNRSARYSPLEQQRIRDSVGQAAPVLANLRNLAIAELRAATDSLTGLPNKRAVNDTLKRMLAQASRSLSPMALLLLDLDHFKDVNDRFGHPVGDQVLANVGAALQSVLRDSDFAGRNGGEEFAVLLPDTDIAGAVLTAEKIRTAIADITLPGVDVSVTTSVGLAGYPEHATSPERLERLADSALYVAKRLGRNRVEVATRDTEPNLNGSAESFTLGDHDADADETVLHATGGTSNN